MVAREVSARRRFTTWSAHVWLFVTLTAVEWLGGPARPGFGPALDLLLAINALLFLWRLTMRFGFVAAAYGWREGVRALPRTVTANILSMIAARRALAPGGSVIVMDERVAESLTPGDATELFFATASVLWCLPQGRVDPTSEAPGTVMRPDTFEAIARRAGYGGVEVLPIEHPFWRFYRPLVG